MNLKEELVAESVSHLDLLGFSQVNAGITIGQALAQMQTQGHNVCLVTEEGGSLIGIFTDRDILRKVVGQDRMGDLVESIMTPEPITVSPNFSAADALWLMDRKQVRNLPVVDENGKITGTMTHRAIVRYLASRYPTIVLNLPPRAEHYADKAEGGD